VALTLRAGPAADVTLGASGMLGTYDAGGKLRYAIVGGDLVVRIGRTALRMEYLLRRQEFDTSNPDIFKYEVPPADGDFFTKQGAYLELEQPITAALDVVGRVDGLYRMGNVSNAGVGSGTDTPTYSPLTDKSYVARETLAVGYALDRNLRVKGSVELWEFSYEDPSARTAELSFHLGAAGSF
jgi:hypothetical protein